MNIDLLQHIPKYLDNKILLNFHISNMVLNTYSKKMLSKRKDKYYSSENVKIRIRKDSHKKRRSHKKGSYKKGSYKKNSYKK